MKRQEILIGLGLLLLVVGAKAPTLPTLYHWDEMGAYVHPARYLMNHSLWEVLPKRENAGAFFGHPPLLYVTVALAYRVLGESPVVSHSVILVFAFLGVYYTYRLGRYLAGDGAGILAAIFLFTTPLYFAQAGLVMGEMSITALGVMAVYYAVRGRYLAYALCGTLAVLFKETALAIVAGAGLYVLLAQRHERGLARRVIACALPALVLAGFFLWQRLATGKWVCNSYFVDNPLFRPSAGAVLEQAVWVMSWTFLRQYRVVLVFLIVLDFAVRGRGAWRREYIAFALIVAFFVVAFWFLYFGQRYILPCLPYLCVGAAAALAGLVHQRAARAATGALAAALFVVAWYGHDTGYGAADYDLQYLDVVAIHRQACAYVEEHYPEARVAARWPLQAHLGDLYQGYVRRPVRTVRFDEPFDVLFYATGRDLSPKQLDELVTLRNRLTLERRFERNGKWLELYRR